MTRFDASVINMRTRVKLCDEIARLRSELAAARTAIERLQDALRWCSGSADFNEGGRAYAGWQKVCAPLLEPQREDAP